MEGGFRPISGFTLFITYLSSISKFLVSPNLTLTSVCDSNFRSSRPFNFNVQYSITRLRERRARERNGMGWMFCDVFIF